MSKAVKNPGSVAFCILNNHHMMPDAFFWSYLRMKRPRSSFAVKGDTAVKSSTFNDAIYKAMALGAEWMFLMDVDQTFHPDTIPRLLETAERHQARIVSALAHLGKAPFSPLAGWAKTNDKGDWSFTNSKGLDWKKNYAPLGKGVVEVDWASGGGLLVHREVVEALQWPPFQDVWEEGTGRRVMGHDVSFCLRAKDKGFKIVVDTDVKSDHGKFIHVNQEFAEAFNAADMLERMGEAKTAQAQEAGYWDVVWGGEAISGKVRDKAYAETFKDALHGIMGCGDRVADVGCGAGAFLDYLKGEMAGQFTGYDFSETAIELVKEKGFGGKVADFRTYIPNGDAHSFDAVVSNHVIEHVPDEERFVTLLRTLVRPGGKVVVATPWREEIQGHFEHVRGYTEESLREILGKKFKDVSITRNSRDFVAVCAA
jgi:2-polyprenyl-3-methyl-5-hydroxy-6-metoxy-1,4-benzoquinol methylase